jgi:hypothetical protein
MFGISPFEEHGEIVIQNSGESVATIRVQRSVVGAPLDLTLDPGESAVIPAFVSSGPLTGFTMSIENRSGDIAAFPASLTITETYAFELGSIGAGSAPQFWANLNAPSVARTENLNIQVVGRDPNPGSTLYFAAREAGAPSAVGGALPGVSAAGSLSSVVVGPNPFTANTRITFSLGRAGAVDLALYDAQGREVRRFIQGQVQPGRWAVSWDGRDAGGEELPGGVYFYHLAVDSQVAAKGKVVRIR